MSQIFREITPMNSRKALVLVVPSGNWVGVKNMSRHQYSRPKMLKIGDDTGRIFSSFSYPSQPKIDYQA